MVVSSQPTPFTVGCRSTKCLTRGMAHRNFEVPSHFQGDGRPDFHSLPGTHMHSDGLGVSLFHCNFSSFFGPSFASQIYPRMSGPVSHLFLHQSISRLTSRHSFSGALFQWLYQRFGSFLGFLGTGFTLYGGLGIASGRMTGHLGTDALAWCWFDERVLWRLSNAPGRLDTGVDCTVGAQQGLLSPWGFTPVFLVRQRLRPVFRRNEFLCRHAMLWRAAPPENLTAA